MKHRLSQALLIIAGCLVALLLSQYATFGVFATPSTPIEQFTAQNRPFMDAEQLPSRLGGENVEALGQIGGPSYAMAVESNYAYVGVGPSLVILDISEPTKPTVVGQSEVLPDFIIDVVVVGSTAYVADYTGGLRIIDIKNPSAPQEVGSYDTPGQARAVSVAGNYAYVADDGGSLRIIDIKNPSAPQEVSSYDTLSWPNDVTIVGSTAYVTNGNEGLQIIDIKNPTAPQEVGAHDTPGYARHVAIAGDYAYVADSGSGLRIINIKNPEAPQEVGFYETPGDANDVTIAGNYAYVADGRIRIINIKNPSAPQEVGSYDAPGIAYDVSIAGSHAYVADYYEGLRIINIKNPEAPQEVGSYDTFSEAYGVTIAGSTAYVAAGNDGLRIIDIKNPSAPQQVGFYDTPGKAVDVSIAGSLAYVADNDGGLRIINIATPSAPQEVGFYDTPGYAIGVSVAGSYAYVADGESGLRIINIKTPSAPQEVGFYDTPGTAYAVAIAGNYAYVADDYHGLRIINIKNPEAPQEVGVYRTPGRAYNVTVAGSTAYVATANRGLQIIDIKDPSAPQEVGSYDTMIDPRAVSIMGNYAYVAEWVDGLKIINIKDPSAPQEVASYHTPCVTFDVTIAGGVAYVADHECGLIILRFTGADTPTPTPTSTPTNTPTPTPVPPDEYESDDLCEQASPIVTTGLVQPHTFHEAGNADWVKVEVTAGREYLIEALTPSDSPADMVLELYDGCKSVPAQREDPSFTPDIRLKFVAASSGTLYIQITNGNIKAAGREVAYEFSVRALPDEDEATTGALILVAGRNRVNDPLQPNIHHVTNAVYELFLQHGYTGENIYYLASEEIDVDKDGVNDVDESPSNRNLELAITEWARDKVGPEQALTLYLIDHGAIDRLYLNGTPQTVTPDELDSWLDQLEKAVPGVPINVIVEASHSGSFIERQPSVSQAGRVVIASTGTGSLAYPSENGAIFSDAFIEALRRGMSLYGAFKEARTIARLAHPSQRAWLDDDGDTFPNRANDGPEAQQRGLAFANGLPAIQWAPHISDVEIGDITNENGIISARVEDDQGVLSVWADIYKPSYAPPDNSAEEMPLEILPSIRLRDENGDGIYSGLYENFAEEGEYRIVIYATDIESLQAEPVSLTVQVGSRNQLYLPLLLTR